MPRQVSAVMYAGIGPGKDQQQLVEPSAANGTVQRDREQQPDRQVKRHADDGPNDGLERDRAESGSVNTST